MDRFQALSHLMLTISPLLPLYGWGKTAFREQAACPKSQGWKTVEQEWCLLWRQSSPIQLVRGLRQSSLKSRELQVLTGSQFYNLLPKIWIKWTFFFLTLGENLAICYYMPASCDRIWKTLTLMVILANMAHPESTVLLAPSHRLQQRRAIVEKNQIPPWGHSQTNSNH